MAPTVLLEYTKEKQRKRSSQDLSFSMMGKPQKSSQGYCSGTITNHHKSVKMHDSEDVGSTIRADTDDSSSPKRKKCINLNDEKSHGFNVPLQIISMSKMSHTQKKQLEVRLRSELEKIQVFQKKHFSRSASIAGVTTSSVNRNEKNQNSSQMKRGISGRFESSKAAVPPPVSTSNLSVIKECDALLKRVMAHRFAWVFKEPVDVVKLNIPDYHTVIKHPMDLGTIKSKISSGAYTNPWGFVADVRLTFTNAMTYNPPSNNVHIMADTLSKFFETRWKPIEKKLAATNGHVKKGIQVPKPELSSKERKVPPTNYTGRPPKRIKPQMTKEEKQCLTHRLESLLADLPDNIIDFLRRQSGNMSQNSEEIEIDIESLADDTLFELQNLLDKYMRGREMQQQAKTEHYKVEMAKNGVNTSWMHPCKGNDLADEDVDICGDDPPMSSYPMLEIQKDTQSRNIKCSSSSSSSSDSGSSSDSDSSSGSESEEQVSIPKNASKENSGSKTGSDQEKSDIMNPSDVNRPSSEFLPEKDADLKSSLVESNGCQEGEYAPSERKVSPEKLYRAALLRSRFADTILKAREKTLGQGDKDPEKLRREREEIERQQKQERARLKAEAKAAEDARKRAEAEAAAEAKRKRELEREAARQALLKIEKTVEINEDCRILKDLEMLGSAPAVDTSMSIDERTGYALNDIGGFQLGGSNPLEQLGLFMKLDDDEEEEDESGSAPGNDAEEGEID
ncbi:transcription factor GTE9 [Canna indica]|uniref:Transcription factor GTE9 n=1 Tax=Canna indica TaxID=4628 RepID=A0AAQ3Q4G0_9LILI|nr:transcription factor GTE9 [Canna indica]